MAKFQTVNVIEALKKAAAKHAKAQMAWNGTSEYRPALKYYKKLEVFKASNVSFDPATMEAHSYRWWKFVKVIGDTVVFNDYRYSPSTSQHQSKVRDLLSDLGIEIDLEIEAPKGLDNLENAIESYRYDISVLRGEIANPRSRKGKNARRLQDIETLEGKIKEVQFLIDCENQSYNQKAA